MWVLSKLCHNKPTQPIANAPADFFIMVVNGDRLSKPGRNEPCPCGSGKKYKRCCIDKKTREHSVMIGSSEPLSGVYYDKEKMEFTGITHDNHLIKPAVTYSQTHYKSESGKERVITRIQDKVVVGEPDILRYLSSTFDVIVAMDTNTKVILGERISACGIVHCILQRYPDAEREGYYARFPWQKTLLFRNSPSNLSPEKFAWITEIRRIKKAGPNMGSSRVALVTDHDMNNHTLFNDKESPIFGDIYLPDNFTLLYGRGDGSSESILNELVMHCDKEASIVLEAISESGFYQDGKVRYSINQIPAAVL